MQYSSTHGLWLNNYNLVHLQLVTYSRNAQYMHCTTAHTVQLISITTVHTSSHCALTCPVLGLQRCCGGTWGQTLCTAHTRCTRDTAPRQTCVWWPGRSSAVGPLPATQGLRGRRVRVGCSAMLQQRSAHSVTGLIVARQHRV